MAFGDEAVAAPTLETRRPRRALFHGAVARFGVIYRRFMKKFFALFLLSAAALCAQSTTLDLGSHGQLSVYVLDHWKTETSDYGDRQMLTIQPTNDVNATCTVTVTFPERDQYDTKARLKQRVEIDAQQLAEGSVEGRAVAREIEVKGGYGFYCSFTDPALVGKKAPKGEFKVISVGAIRFAPDVLITFEISADDFKGQPYQQLLGAIEGMEFSGPATRRRR
jgi:hypothetical protein